MAELPEKITADLLIKRLAIVQENYLEEAAKQPQYYLDAARYRIAKMQLRTQAAAELETYRAKLGLKIRAMKDEEGKKATESTINQTIEVQSAVQKLRVAFETTVQQEEMAKLILNAYQQRLDVIKIIAKAQPLEGVSEDAEVAKIVHAKLSKQAQQLAAQKKLLEEEDD